MGLIPGWELRYIMQYSAAKKKKNFYRNRASYLPSSVPQLGHLGKVHVEVPSFTLLVKNIPAGRKWSVAKKKFKHVEHVVLLNRRKG